MEGGLDAGDGQVVYNDSAHTEIHDTKPEITDRDGDGECLQASKKGMCERGASPVRMLTQD